ncbi:MAG TPA: hypothetical protein VJ787_10150 [Thermoleophilia bacterium]|nr:hypothetical protein [Thermoleophilia bacterium]
MDALRTAIPYALAVYFIYRGTRSRIFLLGIPFLMYIRSAVFFEKAHPFWMPGRFSADFHVFSWLVLVWILCTGLLLPRSAGGPRSRPFGPRLSYPEEGTIVLLGVLALLELVVTTLRHGDPEVAVGEGLGFFYLLAGYFLVRGIVSSVSLEHVLEFVRVLVIVNTGAAVLFILHQGLHLRVYTGAEFMTTVVAGQTITRTYYFMPQLVLLSIAYIFARRSWTAWTVAAAVINLGAVWISYTRSLLAIAAVIIALSLVVRFMKLSTAGAAVRRTMTVGVLLVALFVGATSFFPVQSQFFLGRLSEVATASSVSDVRNINYREWKFRVTYEGVAARDPVLGAGFVSAAQDSMVATVDRFQSDIVWVPVLFRLGVTGIGLFGLAFILYGWRAARLAAHHSGDVELFSIVWLCLLAGLFLEGFVSWSFMQPGRMAMGLWAFAFLGGVVGVARSQTHRATLSRP